MTEPTRERIVRAALRVMGQHGIAGLTNRRVAAEAEVSLGSLTYHFASQTELLRESLLAFVAAETQRIQAIAESVGGSVTSVEQASAVAQAAIAAMTPGPEEIGVYEVYVHCARDSALRDAARACFAAYQQVATALLAQLGVADANRLAPHVVDLIAGAQLRRLATGARDAEGIGDALLSLLAGATAITALG